MNRAARLVGAVLVGAVLVGAVTSAGCSALSPQRGVPAPVLYYDPAAERVERMISDAAVFLDPAARLESGDAGDNPCGGLALFDPQERFDGRYQVGRSYFVRNLPAQRSTAELIAAMRAHWVARGYTVVADHPEVDFVGVDDPDGYGISISANPFGDVTLAASSPCAVPGSGPGR